MLATSPPAKPTTPDGNSSGTDDDDIVGYGSMAIGTAVSANVRTRQRHGTLAQAYLDHRIIRIPTNLTYIALSAISEIGFALYFQDNVIQAHAWWVRFAGLLAKKDWELSKLMQNQTLRTIAKISVFGEAAAATLIALDAEETITSVLDMLENIFRRLCCRPIDTDATAALLVNTAGADATSSDTSPLTVKQATSMLAALVAVYWCTGIITAGTYSGLADTGWHNLAIVSAVGQALLHIATTKDNPAKYALKLLTDVKDYLATQSESGIFGFLYLHSGAAFARSTMVVVTALGLAAKGSITSTVLGITSIPAAIFMNLVTATRAHMAKQTLRNEFSFLRFCGQNLSQSVRDCVTGTHRNQQGVAVVTDSWLYRVANCIALVATGLFGFNREAMLILLFLSITNHDALNNNNPTDVDLLSSGLIALVTLIPTLVVLNYFAPFFRGGSSAFFETTASFFGYSRSSATPTSPLVSVPGGSNSRSSSRNGSPA